VALGCEPLGQVAVPPLGTADGVREQAVVDEADAHGIRQADTQPALASPAVPLRVVLIGGVALILAGLVYVLSQSGYEQTGTDAIKPETFVAVVPAGARICQGPGLVGAKTGRVATVIGSFGKPGPPLGLVMRRPGGAVVATGGLRPGWREGPVGIPLARPLKADAAPVLCFVNRGRSRLAFAGVNSPVNGSTTTVDGKRVGASRVGDAHGAGSWMFWAAIVLGALAAAGTVLLLARAPEES